MGVHYRARAVVERFWARKQVELLGQNGAHTRVELANAMFEFLEFFLHRQWRHSALGMRTPIGIERVHHDSQSLDLQNQAS